MRSARCWPAILTAITCLGCAATVGVEFDPAENFSGYESWAWLERRGSQLRVSGASFWGLHDRIVEEVERALGERGFVQAPGAGPADPELRSAPIEPGPALVAGEVLGGIELHPHLRRAPEAGDGSEDRGPAECGPHGLAAPSRGCASGPGSYRSGASSPTAGWAQVAKTVPRRDRVRGGSKWRAPSAPRQ